MVTFVRYASKSAALVVALLSLSLSLNAFAAQNMFLEIDGIKGESTSAQGPGMIELLSFSHGVSMPLTSGPSNTSKASGRCVHQDFTVSMRIGLELPTLLLKTCGGENIKAIKLHLWRADAAGKPVEYATIATDSNILTSVSYGGAGEQPVANMTFSYKQITWSYGVAAAGGPGGSKGKNSSTWNLEENKGK